MNLTVLLWLPLAFGLVGLLLPGVATRVVATVGALGDAGPTRSCSPSTTTAPRAACSS